MAIILVFLCSLFCCWPLNILCWYATSMCYAETSLCCGCRKALLLSLGESCGSTWRGAEVRRIGRESNGDEAKKKSEFKKSWKNVFTKRPFQSPTQCWSLLAMHSLLVSSAARQVAGLERATEPTREPSCIGGLVLALWPEEASSSTIQRSG